VRFTSWLFPVYVYVCVYICLLAFDILDSGRLLKIWGVWGQDRKKVQLDQKASRAKGLYLRSSWIVEDMSICRYIGTSVYRYIDILIYHWILDDY
jgi:hypothetical protein